MIYFITNDTEHLEYYSNKDFPNITVLKDDWDTRSQFLKWIELKQSKGENEIGFDKETNGLDAWINDNLLDILGDGEDQYVFHSAYCEFKYYLIIVQFFKFIGHNIKFDMKFALVNDDFNISNVYDTMIAEQRLYMK